MGDYWIYIVIALVIALALWVVFAKVLKNKKPKDVSLKDVDLDIDAFIKALGGIENIKETLPNGSKINIFVEKDDLIQPDVLKQLGASGIIQSTGKVTVIMGKISSLLSDAINHYK